MVFTRADLEGILENGFSDLDESDPYQVCAKVYLDFPECTVCKRTFTFDYIVDSDGDGYLKAADDLREAGWKCNTPISADMFDLRLWCSECLPTIGEGNS